MMKPVANGKDEVTTAHGVPCMVDCLLELCDDDLERAHRMISEVHALFAKLAELEDDDDMAADACDTLQWLVDLAHELLADHGERAVRVPFDDLRRAVLKAEREYERVDPTRAVPRGECWAEIERLAHVLDEVAPGWREEA